MDTVNTIELKGLYKGALVKVYDKLCSVVIYARVVSFYPITSGGYGTRLKVLTAGSDTMSMPINHIESVTHFNSLEAMRSDMVQYRLSSNDTKRNR